MTVSENHDRSDSFGVEITRNGTSALVALVGELDLATIEAVRRELRTLRRANVRRLFIDLRRLTFMGSTGLRLLVELDAGSRADGYELVVIKGPPAVHRVISLVGLEDRLPLVDRPDAAGFTHTPESGRATLGG